MDRRVRIEVGVGLCAAVVVAVLIDANASANSNAPVRNDLASEQSADPVPPPGKLEVCVEGADVRARAFIEGPGSLAIREIRENKRYGCSSALVPPGPYTVGTEEPRGACKMVSLQRMSVQRLGNRFRPVPLLPQLLTYVAPGKRTTVTFTFTCSPRLPAGTILGGLIPKPPPGAAQGQPPGAPSPATPPR